MKKRVLVAVTVLATLALAAIGASATDGNLVTNGGFEAPVVAATQGWDIYDSGYTGLGWIVEWRSDVPASWGGWNRPYPAHLELHRGVNNWLPHLGDQHAELDTDWNDHVGSLNNEPASVKIYQNLATCPGETYTLQYAWSPRPTHGNNVLEVWWDGEKIATHTGSGGSNTAWTVPTWTPTASTQWTELAFVEGGTNDSLGMFLDDVSVVGPTHPCVLEVDIDIKPGSYPNCFNINGHGVIPVAILGSADFDVTQVDVPTLEFGGLDVRVKGNGAPQCSVEDVSGDFTYPEGAPDGYDDLVCQFVDDAGAWTPDDGTATLSGELYDGTLIEGSDEICLRPE
jgi:hypothetical protein